MQRETLNHTRSIAYLCVSICGVMGFAGPAFGQPIYEDFKVFGADGGGSDQFGVSISVDGDIIAVGASSHQHNSAFSAKGAVYLFDTETGNELFELSADDAQGSDRFGSSVSVFNGVVLIGANGDDDNGSNAGSSYVFDAFTGTQLFKLLADDGASGDRFGDSVATDGQYAVIGAAGNDDLGSNSGSAYVFDVATGEQLFKLLPDDGASRDGFGHSVAIANGIVVVGAPLDDDPEVGQNMGSAYIFNAATGVQIFKVIPGNGFPRDMFGSAVAVGDGVVVVGSPAHGKTKSTQYGSAYVFGLGAGFQLFELSPVDPEQGDNFGESLAVRDGMVVVGARGSDDDGAASGSAYLFESQTGNRIGKLLASDAAEGDNFGRSVGTSGGIVVVGGNQSQGGGINSGAAYVFGAPDGGGCLADLTGDGVLDFFDVSAFLSAFGQQDPIADFTDDGIFDFFDISAFLGAFAAGCP